ncbi:hypothetical protein D0C36_15880 [Mucilaginibacter conchicola]|uniref:DEP domain-containing protein n=1 Tax=Mucilaginibacter conchicola TaxID=2303333 RepID=A0A372NVV3_9SPHI|nr:SMEK domain-containing protein [Mucilaginibacter conchicola]RFZ92869.1 hypothetical protein D0C36_15880 [Mucilaginibacter conchicola]
MSNHNKLLVSIRDYLSRFQLQVKIATANSEYDINHHAENILVPLLNIVFDSKLRNANDSEKKHFESIDLIDDQIARIGVQVTATNSIEKVKSTLSKFLKYGHDKHIDKLYVYILTEKQRNYSQLIVDGISSGKTLFNNKEQIIDATDLYGLIKRLNDVKKFQAINDLLEQEFSDLNIANDFNYSDFAGFKASYTEKCLNNFSRLNFFGLSVNRSRPREVELYELFVPPHFRNIGVSGATKDWIELEYTFPKIDFVGIEEFKTIDLNIFEKLAAGDFAGGFNTDTIHERIYRDGFMDYGLKDLFSKSQHTVLLGNPGAGKSSIIKYSICKILENDETVFSNEDIYRFIPFRIELHKYNQVKIAHGISFAEFLVKILASEFQTNISLDRVIKILTYFPCLVFFDGIDEIFDIQERIGVRNDIQNFATTYPDVKVVVTSRYESYEEVSFDKFYRLEVKNFNQEQLVDYVRKWYNQEETDLNRREQEIAGCIAQLANVDKELKYNPLLLSLILILYRNELELPTNKLSIYEGCTNTIVEHRDEKEKKLKFNLAIHNKASVFSAIAFWQFDSSNRSITNSAVQLHLKRYLIENGEIEDEHQADKAATEFLEFAKLRSIYFENKFTHKTFLEYFTAYYIFTKYYIGNSQERFTEILSKNLGLSSWAVVLELLVCKVDQNIGGPKLFRKIIDEQLAENKNDALLFFLQILKYLTNINEKTVVDLIILAIQNCFAEKFPLKESKIVHKPVLFECLVTIYAVPRFKAFFFRVLEVLVGENTLSNSQLFSFIDEFSNAVNSDEPTVFLEGLINAEESPRRFFFKNLRHIQKSYLSYLKEFVERFGVKQLKDVYQSSFDLPLFFGQHSFNWILSFVVSAPPVDCEKQYMKLRDIGLSQSEIRNTLARNFLSKPELEPYAKLLIGLPKSGFRDFVKTMVKSYKQMPDESGVKFYDTFYTKYKNR